MFDIRVAFCLDEDKRAMDVDGGGMGLGIPNESTVEGHTVFLQKCDELGCRCG